MRGALAAAAAAAVAALALAAADAPPAHAAGTYTVYVCADGNGSGRNNAFSPSSYGAGVTRGSPSCSPGEGLHTQVGNWNGPYYYPEGGSFAACAPAGTTISAYSASEFSAWQGSGFERRVDGGPCGGFALQAAGPLGNTFGAELNTGGYGTWRQSGLAVGGLRFITYCANAAPTPCTGSYAATNWRDVTVTVSDPAKPQLSNGSGVYGTTGWLRGDQSVGFSAADSSGVIVLRADVDRDAAGNAALRFTDDEDVAGHCDWARMAPCRTSESLAPRTIDTTRLPDGEHAVTLYARDSAANSDEARGTFLVDNSPPSAALVRPPGATGRTVTWKPADAGAGIDQASLVAEYATSGGAWQSLQAGSYDAVAGTYSATLPVSVAADQVQVRLRGSDRAKPGGNPFTTAAVTITVDTRPSAPSIAVPAGWLNAQTVVGAGADLTTPPPLPASGIAGYSLTRDGSDPDATVDVPGATARYGLAALPDGATVVKVRAVSGSGTAGDTRQATVRVDRAPPTTLIYGAGNPLTPHPRAITASIVASDATSGMGDSGHVAYRLDGGDLTRVAGDQADVAVSGEGRHTIVYHAVDAAGNASDDVTRTIWIQAGASREPARGGFWSTSANPVATFTAAKRFGAPCPAAVTLTADRDAYVDAAAPDATFGSAATGWIGGGRRVVIGFPLPPAPDCTVASAELRLTTVGGAGARRVDAYRAGASWNEASVAWATQPGYLGTPASSTTGAWDVTAQVQALYRSGDNGLLLRDADEGGAAQEFATREAATASSRPQLVLRFDP